MKYTVATLIALMLAFTFVSSAFAEDEVYVIKSGDTLSEIALQYGVTVEVLAHENGIQNVGLIFVGNKLRIPKPVAGKDPVTNKIVLAPIAAPNVVAEKPTNVGIKLVISEAPMIKAIYDKGQGIGNKRNVFTVVGDSNSATNFFLYHFDHENYSLGNFSYLAEVLTVYRGSFTGETRTSKGGYSTMSVLTKNLLPGCPNETPLECELREKRPSVALIMLGTNDYYMWQDFGKRLEQIIDKTIAYGVVPILFTKVDSLEDSRGAPHDYINNEIRRLGKAKGILVVDMQVTLNDMYNKGLAADGIHFNAPSDGQVTRFDNEHLKYGFTVRNLLALQALYVVRNQTR